MTILVSPPSLVLRERERESQPINHKLYITLPQLNIFVSIELAILRYQQRHLYQVYLHHFLVLTGAENNCIVDHVSIQPVY